MSFEYPSGPEAEAAYDDYVKKHEEARKRRLAHNAELEPRLAAVKKIYDKEMSQIGHMQEGRRSLEAQAASLRHQRRIEQITGVDKQREEWERDYARRQGHPFSADARYAPDPTLPGGLGSGLGAVRDTIREFATEAAKASRVTGNDAWLFAIEQRVQEKLRGAFVMGQPEYKSFQGRLIERKSAMPAGQFEALVSVTNNEDLVGDIVQVHAFRRFLSDVAAGKAKTPALIWSHQLESGQTIGKVLDLQELEPGNPLLPADLQAAGYGALKLHAQINLRTARGRDAWESLREKEVSEFSFMYQVARDSIDKKGRRLLHDLYPIHEVSPVVLGANPLTRTLSLSD
jgi:HK97 family phage prohead protease